MSHMGDLMRKDVQTHPNISSVANPKYEEGASKRQLAGIREQGY